VAAAVARIRPRLATRHLPVLLLIAVFVTALIVIMHAGRGTTFYYDDWEFVQDRTGWRPHIFLFPHNEHFSLLPVLVYKVLLTTVGLEHYGAFRFVAALFDLTCGALLFIYVRRRLGDWLALGFATTLVLAGSSAWDIVWPFQIGFLGSLAAGLAALLLLDNGTRRSDIAACVMLAVSVSSSGQGLVFLAAVLLEIVLRPDRRRRLWIPLAPLVLYGAWYLKYGDSSVNWGDGLQAIPNHIFNGLPAGAITATGLPGQYGGALAIALVVAVLYSVTRAGARLPRLLAVVALPLVFWVLMSLARTELPPDEARYIYPTTLFVILVAAEAFALVVPQPPINYVLAALLGLGALANAQGLNLVGNTLREQALKARTSITAAELLRDRLAPGNQIQIPDQPAVTLGGYERAVKAYDSTIAWTPDVIPKLSAPARAGIDAALIRLIAPTATADESAASELAQSGCGSAPANGMTLPIKRGQVFIEPGNQQVDVRLRRFGDAFPEKAQISIAAHVPSKVDLPSDRSKQPWIAALRSATPFKACPR
jgi:hypothetical protein